MSDTPRPPHVHRWFEYGERPIKCRDCGEPTANTLAQARAALDSIEGSRADTAFDGLLRRLRTFVAPIARGDDDPTFRERRAAELLSQIDDRLAAASPSREGAGLEHSHVWLNGEFHLNGCNLPHDYPRMTFASEEQREDGPA